MTALRDTTHVTDSDRETAKEILADIAEPDGWPVETVVAQWVCKLRYESFARGAVAARKE